MGIVFLVKIIENLSSMNNYPEIIIFRKSHIFLILKLLYLEIFIVGLYLIVRIPKSIFFSSFLNLSENQFLNVSGVVYFIVLSIVEIILVLRITLGWSNEEFEIREESLVHRRGIFRLKQQTYTLKNLGSVNIYQGLVGKMLNYGNIVLTSPILKQDIVLSDIHNPQKILASLEDNIERTNVHNLSIIKRTR